jgi:hypothetical protein
MFVMLERSSITVKPQVYTRKRCEVLTRTDSASALDHSKAEIRRDESGNSFL